MNCKDEWHYWKHTFSSKTPSSQVLFILLSCPGPRPATYTLKPTNFGLLPQFVKRTSKDQIWETMDNHKLYTLSTCIENNHDDILLSGDQERDVCLASSLEKLPRPPALRISRPLSSQRSGRPESGQSFPRNQRDHERHEGVRPAAAGGRHPQRLLRRPLHPQREGGRGTQRHRCRRYVARSVHAMEDLLSSILFPGFEVSLCSKASVSHKQTEWKRDNSTPSPLVRAVCIFDDISSCSLTVDFDTGDIWGSEAEKVFSTKRTVLSGVRILIRQIWAAPPAERPNGGLTSTANKWNKVNKLSQLHIFSSSNCLGPFFEGWLCKTLINQNPDSK